jgi:prolyl-tRNA synthetase
MLLRMSTLFLRTLREDPADAEVPSHRLLIRAGSGQAAPQVDAAVDLAGQLAARGLLVLVDDRTQVSAGVKFADAELIGIPRAVVVGRRLADGYVEVRHRATDERFDLPVAELVDRLAAG